MRVDFPALASLDALPNNLPSQISSFVGREHELDELQRLLLEHRLVTIAGSGGMGKTRLALQVAAAAIERFTDGAWFVDLSTIADSALVAQTIAAALNVIETPREAIGDTLLRELERKHLLLVVDNAEHVLAGVAPIVKAILTRCAGATVLATSREPLHLTGEQTYRLSALPDVPANASAADLLNHDGTRLFLDRARAIAPTLTVNDGDAAEICALCGKLEGIPLAIELAAARVATLSFRQLNERLGKRLGLLASRDATVARHRTLRETIEWSYRLLSDDEKRALAALAAFAGALRWKPANASSRRRRWLRSTCCNRWSKNRSYNSTRAPNRRGSVRSTLSVSLHWRNSPRREKVRRLPPITRATMLRSSPQVAT